MSGATFPPTMEDMKSAESGYNQWQGHRNPLPMPPRMPTSYDGQNPGSSVVLPYHGGAPLRTSYHPMETNVQRDVRPPQQPREHISTASRPALTTHHSYPSLKRPYQNLDDAAYNENIPETYDGGMESEASANPTINPDHRLLSFGRLPDRHTILDRHGRSRIVEISAQIHGMFFLSEIATNSGEGVIIQPELTCYRRNLFQISGTVTGPTGPLSALNERNEAVPIVSQELSISAIESVDNHIIRLIVIPWKTPPPNSPEVPPNHEQEPLPIPIFHPADGGQDPNSDMTVQSIAWRRLQFRVATANNGRRKELQQHFILRLKLTATLATGAKLCVGECSTAPIVVRGRSPRNFQARKEIPLGGSGSISRAQTLQSPLVDRKSPASSLPEKFRGPAIGLDVPKRPYQFDGSNFPASPPALRNMYAQWNHPQPQGQHAPNPGSGYAPQQSQQANAQYSHVVSPHSEVPPTHAPSIVSSQISNAEAMNRPGYYHSNTQGPPISRQYIDGNPRPAKSPRHNMAPDVGSQPTYPAFEARLGSPYAGSQPGQQGMPAREYFPAVLPSESWTSQGQSNVSAHGTIPGQSNIPAQGNSIYQTSVPSSSHHYAYHPESYIKDESQQTHYTWGSE